MSRQRALTLALMVGWALTLGLSTVDTIYGALGGYAAFVVLALGFAAGREGMLRGLRPNRRTLQRRLGWALVVALGMVLATHLLHALSVQAFPTLGAMIAREYALRGPGTDGGRIALMLVVIAAEELLWRGQALGPGPLLRGRWAAPAVSFIAYVLVQLPLGSPVVLLLAVGCGAVWTVERLWLRSVLAPVITHATWNIAMLVVWPVSSR